MSAFFSAKHHRHQCFPFRNSLTNYIFKNLNINLKEKLSQTCKLLFFYYPFDCIVEEVILGIRVHLKSHEQTPKRWVSCLTSHQLNKWRKNIWLTENLGIYSTDFPISLTPVIARCTAKDLDFHCDLSIKDFELLTEAGTVEQLYLRRVGNEKGYLAIEDIIARVPNAHEIRCPDVIVTPQTAKSLFLLKRKKKIRCLYLGNINSALDDLMLYRFLNKATVSRAVISIHFVDANIPNIYKASKMAKLQFKFKLGQQ